MYIKLTVENVWIEPMGTKYIETTLEGVSPEDVLENIGPKEVLEHYGANTLLDLIGEEEARAYFGFGVAP